MTKVGSALAMCLLGWGGWGCGDSGSGPDGDGGGGGGSVAGSCSEVWSEVEADVGECSAGALAAVAWMNLDGITIDNNGASMTPCLEVKCDASFAYVVSNALPHYDFVQTTPNALQESFAVYKVPLGFAPATEDPAAVDVTSIASCEGAYETHLAGGAATSEPSGLCGIGAIYQDLASGERLAATAIECLGTIGVLTNGVPVYGPNEGAQPEPFGTPMFVMPDTADEPASDEGGMSVALDLCGGHTAGSMHYHAVNDGCFEQREDGSPARTYVDAASDWNVANLFEGECEVESPVVGFAFDGAPIKGPCVCVARDGAGACTDLKRARSSWVYGGLSRWGEAAAEPEVLGDELTACASDADCGCEGAGCAFYCKRVLVDDPAAPGGASSQKVCVLHAYAWCVHEHVDRSATDVSAEAFVYLDRCNGFAGPDGYAYHATPGFPHMVGCSRGQVTGSAEPIGGAMGGPGPGGPP